MIYYTYNSYCKSKKHNITTTNTPQSTTENQRTAEMCVSAFMQLDSRQRDAVTAAVCRKWHEASKQRYDETICRHATNKAIKLMKTHTMSKITKVLKNIYFQKKNYFQKYKKKILFQTKIY